MLSRSQLHFIHCLVPTSVESKTGQGTPSPPQPGGDQGGANKPPALDIPALRVQLAGSHILEALRLHRAGKKQMGTRCPCPGGTHYALVSHRTGTFVISQRVTEHKCPLWVLRCACSEKSCTCFPFLQMKQLRFKIVKDSSGSHCRDKSTGISGVPDFPCGFQNCFWLQRARPSLYTHHGKSGSPQMSKSLRFQNVSQCEDLCMQGDKMRCRGKRPMGA